MQSEGLLRSERLPSPALQYLQQPERVFAEVFRVLKPGGVCIVTFSNRLFYDKVRTAASRGFAH